jgi:hypothetical protein
MRRICQQRLQDAIAPDFFRLEPVQAGIVWPGSGWCGKCQRLDAITRDFFLNNQEFQWKNYKNKKGAITLCDI